MAANAVPEVYDPPQARIGRQQLTLPGRSSSTSTRCASGQLCRCRSQGRIDQAIQGLDLPDPVVEPHRHPARPPGNAWPPKSRSCWNGRCARKSARTTWPTNAARCPPACGWTCPTRTRRSSASVVQDLLVPNSFFNPERTEQRRQEARDAVEPVSANARAQRDDPARRRYRHGPGHRGAAGAGVAAAHLVVAGLSAAPSALCLLLGRRLPLLPLAAWSRSSGFAAAKSLLLAGDRGLHPGRQADDPRADARALPLPLRRADHHPGHRAQSRGSPSSSPPSSCWSSAG